MPTNTNIDYGLDLIKSDPSRTLSLRYGSKAISTVEYISRTEAQSIPEISFSAASKSATYILLILDLDAPFVSFNFLSPILHAIQPGFKLSSASDTLTSTESPITDYVGPAPPPGAAPHRYTFLLYEQPGGFEAKTLAPADGKPLSTMARTRFNLKAWEEKAGLGKPIAANYFKSN